MNRKILTFLLLLTPVFAQCPDFSSPGPYNLSYRTEDIPSEDETMSGSRIYYPVINDTIPAAAVPCPIVVFGHGFNIGIDKYYSYGEHFASHGFITVLPTISNPVFTPNHNYRSRLIITAAHYVADLNDDPGDIFEGAVDVDNWAFVGHSMGGSISLLAGDRYVNYPDSIYHIGDTLRAIVSYASPQSDPETVDEHITTPVMMLTGENDGTAPWEDVYSAFWVDKPPPGAFALVNGANHCYYCDESSVCDWFDSGADITREEQRSIARLHTTAFLYHYQFEDTGECVLQYAYGDSIQSADWMDSVEVRYLPLKIEERHKPSDLSDIFVYPNPGNSSFSIEAPFENVKSVELYDCSGRLVATSVKGKVSSDGYFIWEPDDKIPSGQYLIKVHSTTRISVGKLIVLR